MENKPSGRMKNSGGVLSSARANHAYLPHLGQELRQWSSAQNTWDEHPLE